jgi:hypothetical protein
MTWFKVDDHLHAHSKAVRAGTEAMGLWVLAGSWSAAEESDGWVPGYMLVRLAGVGADDAAERLVAAGLWEHTEQDGDAGYRFHAWDEYQPTSAQLEAKREQARERMRSARSQGGAVRANGASTSQSVTPTPPRPDPTTTKTPAAKAASEPDGFAEFWQACPRKIGKTAAAKAYAKALQSTTPEVILHGIVAAAGEWKAARTEERFVPHPATWLNQGRWADEHPTLTPDAPTVRVTARQCPATDVHARHPWQAGEQPHMCLGVSD